VATTDKAEAADVAANGATHEQATQSPVIEKNEDAGVAATGAGDLIIDSALIEEEAKAEETTKPTANDAPYLNMHQHIDNKVQGLVEQELKEGQQQQEAFDTAGQVEEEAFGTQEPTASSWRPNTPSQPVGASCMVPEVGGEGEGAEATSVAHGLMEDMGSQGRKSDEGHEEEAAADPSPSTPAGLAFMTQIVEPGTFGQWASEAASPSNKPAGLFKPSTFGFMDTADFVMGGFGRGCTSAEEMGEPSLVSSEDVQTATQPHVGEDISREDGHTAAAQHQQGATVAPSPPSPTASAPSLQSLFNYKFEDMTFGLPGHVAPEAQEETPAALAPAPAPTPTPAPAPTCTALVVRQAAVAGQQDAAEVAVDAPPPGPQPQVRHTHVFNDICFYTYAHPPDLTMCVYCGEQTGGGAVADFAPSHTVRRMTFMMSIAWTQ
jgi:hypothetical protein